MVDHAEAFDGIIRLINYIDANFLYSSEADQYLFFRETFPTVPAAPNSIFLKILKPSKKKSVVILAHFLTSLC